MDAQKLWVEVMEPALAEVGVRQVGVVSVMPVLNSDTLFEVRAMVEYDDRVSVL